MKYTHKLLLTVLSLSLLTNYGCDNRGTNSRYDENFELLEGGYQGQQGAHVFFYELTLQIGNSNQQMPILGYVPRAAFPPNVGGQLKPVPLLVLLAPQGADEFFYFDHGLKQIADELISNGTIQPMAIACIPNDPTFGGYFYAGKFPGAGNYDTLIGGTLIEYLHSQFFLTTIQEKSKRAIGGMGQGAYGAFRAAIMNPGVFGSVSAIDGPLDFDGIDGNGGFVDLFDDALNEQGIKDSSNYRQLFDSSSTMPLSMMIIGGSLAFSPVDTTAFWHQQPIIGGPPNIIVDSTYKISDTTTVVRGVVTQSNSYSSGFDFLLPCNSNATVHWPVWDMWLANNLENLMTPGMFNGVNLWIATSTDARYGAFNEQTSSFIATLQSEGYPLTVRNYTGIKGSPAEGDQYLYDLLKEMLIFHSENFGD